jgi:myosin heavy subunit
LIEDKYKYLTQAMFLFASLDDVDLYHQLLQSFDIMGISKEEQAGEFEIRPVSDWLAFHCA